MNTSQLSLDYSSTLQKIASLVTTGIDAWKAAGELLVQLYDADPLNRPKIKKDLADLPYGTLNTLERIGRKQVVPQVAQASGIGYRKLQNMPYVVQERLLKEPLELVVIEDGKTDILRVAVKDLTRDQAEQVFDRRELRDAAAQRAWLASVKAKAPPRRVEDAYKVFKDRIVISRPCELTRQQLSSLLAQMG